MRRASSARQKVAMVAFKVLKTAQEWHLPGTSPHSRFFQRISVPIVKAAFPTIFER